MADSDEEYYEVPLRDQKYFGAGIKRRRVHFVPSSTGSLPASPGVSVNGGASKSISASERYLAVVFKKSQSAPPPDIVEGAATKHPKTAIAQVATQDDHYQQPKENLPDQQVFNSQDTQETSICDICKTTINPSHPTSTHTSTLVHQICLPHSHPPSALDRKRKGINILQSYGWDPDARLGLGAGGEGILHPVKAKEKRDTVGLGVGSEYDEEARLRPKKKVKERPKEVKKLDAGQIRKMDVAQKKKDQRWRELFYASEDVERYLGGG